MSQTTVDEELVRVRVWFGRLAIVDRTAGTEVAVDFAQAMGRRFFGHPVTVDPVTAPRRGTDR
ncbi:hypothetical protein ACXC9Q_22825 (plasmid) [Kribbella sp. CWNU-51]